MTVTGDCFSATQTVAAMLLIKTKLKPPDNWSRIVGKTILHLKKVAFFPIEIFFEIFIEIISYFLLLKCALCQKVFVLYFNMSKVTAWALLIYICSHLWRFTNENLILISSAKVLSTFVLDFPWTYYPTEQQNQSTQWQAAILIQKASAWHGDIWGFKWSHNRTGQYTWIWQNKLSSMLLSTMRQTSCVSEASMALYVTAHLHLGKLLHVWAQAGKSHPLGTAAQASCCGSSPSTAGTEPAAPGRSRPKPGHIPSQPKLRMHLPEHRLKSCSSKFPF